MLTAGNRAYREFKTGYIFLVKESMIHLLKEKPHNKITSDLISVFTILGQIPDSATLVDTGQLVGCVGTVLMDIINISLYFKSDVCKTHDQNVTYKLSN